MTTATTVSAAPVVVVEDSDEDFDSLLWAMRRLDVQRPIVRCADGEEALALLNRQGADEGAADSPRPALLLLDLNLLTLDGRAILRRIKGDDDLKDIPVIIWSGSSNPTDIRSCYHAGANSYIVKPTQLNELLSDVALLERYWLRVVKLPEGAEN